MNPEVSARPALLVEGLNLTQFLWFVTKFGGPQLIIPASVGLYVSLWRMDEKESARAFLLAAACCFTAILIGKIALLTVGGIGSVSSPSGHTAISAFFYASLGFLALSLRRSVATAAFALVLTLLVALIGLSRFRVAGHTPMEALVGLICGLLAFEMFRRRGRLQDNALKNIIRAAPAGLITALLVNRLMTFGFPDEEKIQDFSMWLRGEILG